MPLFSNKFSPKKTPTRKATVFLANKNLSPKRIEKELGPEVGPIRLRLGDQEALFESGIWIPGEYYFILNMIYIFIYHTSSTKIGNFVLESGKIGGIFKENEQLKKDIKQLEEENNLLKLKFDVLLDMVNFNILHLK